MIQKSIQQFAFLSLILNTCLVVSTNGQQAQTAGKLTVEFEKVDSGKIKSTASFRGLCVVNPQVIWASGSKGTVIRSADGGETWSVTQIKGAAEIEFRDIHAVSQDEAIVLGAGSPALVFQTLDGGKSWIERYRNENAKIFFDAFGFWNAKEGIAFSDPIDSKLFLLRTSDGGKSWSDSQDPSPQTLTNEAGFAASGTCLTTFEKKSVWIGLGGKPAGSETKNSRVVYSHDRGRTWQSSVTTIARSESAGIFSLAFTSPLKGFAVGGDYMKPDQATSNFSISEDGGKTWRDAKHSRPTGYRSCIAASLSHADSVLIATGTNGTDLSSDEGETWKRASKEGFHAIMFVPGQFSGWATGAGGKVAKFKIIKE